MIHIKKTILTLALLIAATTQAWATDYLYLVIDDGGTSATIYYGDPGDNPYHNDIWLQKGGRSWDMSYDNRYSIYTVTIDESCQTFSGTSLSLLFGHFSVLKNIIGIDNLRTDDVEDMSYMFDGCVALTSLDLSSFNTSNVTDMGHMFEECSKLTTLDLSSFNTSKVNDMPEMFLGCVILESIYVGSGWSTTQVDYSNLMFDRCLKLPGYDTASYNDARMAKLTTAGGFLTYKALPTPVATPATDATNTSLSLTQPAGNVTVSVKYYEQAKFATGLAPAAITGVQAGTDNPIVTPGTVKTIGTSDVKMGTVMYHASQTALTDADLLALGTDDWSSNVPKATNLGTGDAYVYYYIQGAEPASGNAADRSDANTCSDSDIKAANVVNVTLIAPPTYDVSLNKTGLADGEPANWKAKSETVTTEVNLGTNDLEGVTKGETVTVTYTGSRKVIGMKAEKLDNNYMKWDDSQKKWLEEEIPATAIKVVNSSTDVTWAAGTYLVKGDVTIDGQIKLSDDVELIIKDGAKLSAKQIDGNTSYYHSLSVYGQTNMSGELNVACSDGDAICNMRAVNIHSCKVNASSSKEGHGGFCEIGMFNVYGGSVDAKYTGDTYGYGIYPYSLNIYGGEVKAVGKKGDSPFSCGISAGRGVTVTVYGGKLWAESAGKSGIYNLRVTLKKDDNYTTGKIETSDDGITWTEYTGTDTPDDPYVRVGY